MRLGVARSGTVMAEERTTPAVNTLMPPPSPPLLFSTNSRGSVTQDQIAVGTAMAAQEAGATIEATRKNTADVRVEEAATPTTKASDIRSEGPAFLNEPVVSETSKEKRFAKGKSTVAKKAGAGDGVDSDDQECPRGETGDETNIGCGLARLGRGKRPRDGESLRAKKDEEVVIEPILEKVLEASPDIDKLWANCARQLAAIRKCDEQRLIEMEHAILESWGIHPAAARELADNYEGTWLHPTMGREELIAALSEMMPSVAKDPPLVSLGRPYSDVWAEENFISSLEEEEAEGSTQISTVGAAPATASAHGVPTGVDGERRSLRACGRRSSVFGAGAGGGGGCMGGGSGSSGGAGGDGKGGRSRGVVLPCIACRPPTSNFCKILPTHDEARFRRRLVGMRRSMGIGSDVAFGSLKSGLYEMWGKERRGDKEWGGGVVERKGMEDLRNTDGGIEGSSSSSISSMPERSSRGNVSSYCLGGTAAIRVSTASDVTVDSKVNHKINTKVGPKVKTRESSRSTKGLAVGRERRSCRPLLIPRPPPTKEALSAAVLSAASIPEDSCKRVPYALAAAKAVKVRRDTGVNVDGVATEAEVCEEVASAGSRYVGVSGARFAEPVLNSERGAGLVEEETEEDEVSRMITEDWERLKKAEVTALYHIVKLQGLSRQERCVFQGVTDRASDAQDLLSSALFLSLQSRPTATEGKIKVGLAADFPYHDPAEVPVVEARRQRNEAMQKAHWVHEDMAGCSLQELEEEKARREKRKKETTEYAKMMEEAWKPQRLAAGRLELKGRGCGLPVPGGIAHPFLVTRDAADFLYSLNVEQDVEAKDEWGAWCRGKVVGVRGDGGWVPENGDTNVLRAVKVSFEGWGDAIDAWLPLDSGTIAKPGTHLPLSSTATSMITAGATVEQSSNDTARIATKHSAKARKSGTSVSGRPKSRAKHKGVGVGTNGIPTSDGTFSDVGTSVHSEPGTMTPAGSRSKTPEKCRASSKRTRTSASAPFRGGGGEDVLEDKVGGPSVEGATIRCSARRGGRGRSSSADKRAACDRPKRPRGRLGKASKRSRSVNGVVNGVTVCSEGNGTGGDHLYGGDEVVIDHSANGGNSEPSAGVVNLRTKSSARVTPNGADHHPQKDLQALSTSDALPTPDTSVHDGFVASNQRGKRNASVKVAGGNSATVGIEEKDCRRQENVDVNSRDSIVGCVTVGEFQSSGGVTNETVNATTTNVSTRSSGFGLLTVSEASTSGSADAVSSVITKASSNGKSCSSYPAEERASSTSSPSPSSSSSSSTFGAASFCPTSAPYVMRAPPSHEDVPREDETLISGVETESAIDVKLKKLPGQCTNDPKGMLSAALQGSPLMEAYHGAVSDVADGVGKEKELMSPPEGSVSALATNVRANGHVGGARVALRRG